VIDFSLDNIKVKAKCRFDFEGPENTDINGTLDSWNVVNCNSTFGWQYDTCVGKQGAFNNNFGSGAGSVLGGESLDDYLISPSFAVFDDNFIVKFSYCKNYGDTLEQPLSVLIMENWAGDVTITEWIDMTPDRLDGSTAMQ
jgi:hypothetical protein